LAEVLPPDALERANAVSERAIKLEGEFRNLQAFHGLLEALKVRLPNAYRLRPEQVPPVAAVRASLLRSAIGSAIALLDPARSDRASLGQVVALLGEQSVRDALSDSDAARSRKLCDVRDRYKCLIREPLFERVKELRHSAIGHLLIKPTETVEYDDIFALTDEIEALLLTLFEGLNSLPGFIETKQPSIEGAGLFWDAYLTGAIDPKRKPMF
jgi:hypothetical protein